MSTFTDRPEQALLVIDVQTGVMASAHDRDAVIDRIAGLVGRAREAGTPVVWVQHSSEEFPLNSETWQIVPELSPVEGEPIVHKRYGDSFEDTDLESVLAGAQVGHLLVSGAMTDACVRSTLHGAITRGYDTTLISDAHTTEDLSEYGAPTPDQVIAHTNLYWQWQSAPGREGGTVASDDVEFGS